MFAKFIKLGKSILFNILHEWSTWHSAFKHQIVSLLSQLHLGCACENIEHMRTAKVQISLHICAVRPGLLLSTNRIIGCYRIYQWRSNARVSITKTYLYNYDPLKPHFYIVKLGFTGVYIIFLTSVQKHRLWVLIRGGSNEYPQSMLEQKYEKHGSFLSRNFEFLKVKFSIHLIRRVFVMTAHAWDDLCKLCMLKDTFLHLPLSCWIN